MKKVTGLRDGDDINVYGHNYMYVGLVGCPE